MIGQHVVELGFKRVLKLDIINDTILKEKERFLDKLCKLPHIIGSI
jgi:hypothetical protein